MTEEEKKQVATFRFAVIHELVSRTDLERGEQERLLLEKCSRKWQIPFSSRTRLSRTTILRWLRLYQKSHGKIESLYPPDRGDRGQSRAMDEETVLSLIRLRKEFPKLTVARLIEKMQEKNLVGAGVRLKPSTVYRLLRQQGLMRQGAAKAEDRRKFEAELANEIWQSDVMHGPQVKVGEKLRKAYLIALLDDHSRLIVQGQFYLSEGLACFLDAFEKGLLKRGLPRKLYVDNGSAFRSHQLNYICASLGIALIHARPYKPQGKGKIERFFRGVRDDFLSDFEGMSLEELNGAFNHWLDNVYHERKHRSTGQSPLQRFTAKMHCLRPAPENLRDHFRKVARRRVAKDRTVILNGRLFEAPVRLIGKQVELLYHEAEPQRVEIRFQAISYGLVSAVDLHVNCRVKRDKNRNLQVTDSEQTSYQGGRLWPKRTEEPS